MILVYDTETTGIPNKHLDPHHPDQARLVELGMVLCEEDGTERMSAGLLIRQDLPIPQVAVDCHGIDDSIVARCGVDVRHAVSCYCHFLEFAHTVVAFNEKFDRDIISLELLRLGEQRPVEWPTVQFICACDMATPYLALPPTARMLKYGHKGYKRPKLSEAYFGLFGEQLVGAHSALVDARAAARVYFHLRSREGEV
jgi:DNA polymerase III subunit epsilon